MTYPAIPTDAIHAVDKGTQRRKRRLGEMLVEAGLITPERLSQALAYQQIHGGRLGTVLVTLGMLSEADLESNLARQLGIAVCDVESVNPPAELLKLIREPTIKKYEVIPLGRKGKTLILGMTDPFNLSAIDEVLFRTGMRQVEPRLITETTFRRFIATRFSSVLLLDRIANDTDLEATLLQPGRVSSLPIDDETARRVRDADPEAGAPVVVRLTSYLLRQALSQRAGDVHIEPYETFFRVRFRVDGNLHTELTPPQRLHAPLVSRIKILSGMDLSERRRPQEGHLCVSIDDEDLQFRVSTLPTVFGEKVVLRVMRREPHLADIQQLGMRPEQVAAIRKASRLSQGVVLVAGPTGSGKTTTVHAIVNLINEPDTNIVSLEDPVEQAIPGVNHVQVQEKAGLGFGVALKSILRQDPDVVFVGEMRDPEVATASMRAALTGHLILSTLHTSGVVETFTRLVDMGLESHLLASSVQLVVGQRLVRRLCSSCAEVRAIPQEVVDEFQLSTQQVVTAHHRVAVGCPKCLDTGYRGRVGVFEMVWVNSELRDLLRRGAGEQALREACERADVVWMWDAAVAAALAGETSFDEVRRVLTRPD